MSKRENNQKKPHTQASLNKLEAKDGRYEVGVERGLHLEVHPTGEKTWRFRYRFQGKRPKLTLGRFAATESEAGLTLREARIKAAEAEKSLLSGKDPLREEKEKKRAAKVQLTMGSFAQVALNWLEIDHKPVNKPKLARNGDSLPTQDEVYLQRDILPRLGKLELEAIEVTDVWECIDAAKKRGHDQAALRIRGVIKRVYDYAGRKGYKGLNPAAVIKSKSVAKKSQRKRALDFDEIPRWLDELHSSSMSKMMKLAFHTLLLLPGRKTEWLHAPWSEFDLVKGTWDLPEERSKTGVGIKHKLSRQLIRILKELKDIGGDSRWVFPSNRGTADKPVSQSCVNTALRAIDHSLDSFVPHDMRRTTRTGMSEIGIDEATAERCLNHNKANVYDRSVRFEHRADALQKWADHIDKLVTAYQLKKLGLDAQLVAEEEANGEEE